MLDMHLEYQLTEGGVGLTERQQPTYTVRQAVKMTFKFGSTFTTSGARVKPVVNDNACGHKVTKYSMKFQKQHKKA